MRFPVSAKYEIVVSAVFEYGHEVPPYHQSIGGCLECPTQVFKGHSHAGFPGIDI